MKRKYTLLCGNLRNYLYGVTNLEIHTGHQHLTIELSTRNPNSEMKRWHSLIKEFAPKFVYQPGKNDVVVNAMSGFQ